MRAVGLNNDLDRCRLKRGGHLNTHLNTYIKIMEDLKSKLALELEDLINRKFPNDETAKKYLERIKQGALTKRENPQSHMCTYFAPYDPAAKEIFVGHHKKAGKWLVNGGHINQGETLKETLRREIGEEWGLSYDDFKIGEPQLLTICPIWNPEKQPCLEHFDIWHFIPVDKNTFNPDKDKLAEEFHEAKWLSYDDAMNLNTDDNQRKGFKYIAENLFN
jgi:8-oxo-dGTP pyrophosphatase MutT (NUDIX family)